MNAVFKALADESRRKLLDELHQNNGQTLTQLCGGLAMTRQAVTKHLALLEAANLVATVWRGREKLHYLNPVPLHEIYERWIHKYERQHLQALSDLKMGLEDTNQPTNQPKNQKNMKKNDLVYVTFIRTTPEKLWAAITQPEFTRQYWGDGTNISDWKKGAQWRHSHGGAPETVRVVGEVVESAPPKRLVLTWADPAAPTDVSRVTFEIETVEDMVSLTVTHGEFQAGSSMAGRVSWGWPRVLSSLKSFLETGKGLNVYAGGGGCGSKAE